MTGKKWFYWLGALHYRSGRRHFNNSVDSVLPPTDSKRLACLRRAYGMGWHWEIRKALKGDPK